MSKEGFNWKSLFINENETEKKTAPETKFEVNEEISTSHFPKSTSNPTPEATISNEYIDEILSVYQKGFDSLNLNEFEFFEIYKSVMAVGVSNPQSYQMAFAMGKSIRPDLTKEYILEKSKFYLDEIEKVHQKYDSIGKTKRNDLDISITRDKVNLAKEVSDLESQIANLQALLNTKKSTLAMIDSENVKTYTEINQKLEANDLARKKIIDSINTVISGINQYL